MRRGDTGDPSIVPVTFRVTRDYQCSPCGGMATGDYIEFDEMSYPDHPATLIRGIRLSDVRERLLAALAPGFVEPARYSCSWFPGRR